MVTGRSTRAPAEVGAPEWSRRSDPAPEWAAASDLPVGRSRSKAAADPSPVDAASRGDATPPRRGGDEPSRDDEDLESSGAVGQPVIESVLGGTVISVDDTAH